MSKKSVKNQNTESELARYERMIGAATVMTDAEKAELADWEKRHVTGDGKYGSSDWPGWDAIVIRITH